jgi:hypothetical protein
VPAVEFYGCNPIEPFSRASVTDGDGSLTRSIFGMRGRGDNGELLLGRGMLLWDRGFDTEPHAGGRRFSALTEVRTGMGLEHVSPGIPLRPTTMSAQATVVVSFQGGWSYA